MDSIFKRNRERCTVGNRTAEGLNFLGVHIAKLSFYLKRTADRTVLCSVVTACITRDNSLDLACLYLADGSFTEDGALCSVELKTAESRFIGDIEMAVNISDRAVVKLDKYV